MANKHEQSMRDSVAFHVVTKTMDRLSQRTTSFFAKLWQSMSNLNKNRVADHVDDNDEEGGEEGIDNIISSSPQKLHEDLMQEGELVIMVTDLGAGMSTSNPIKGRNIIPSTVFSCPDPSSSFIFFTTTHVLLLSSY